VGIGDALDIAEGDASSKQCVHPSASAIVTEVT
jgi:hypothetical protein